MGPTRLTITWKGTTAGLAEHKLSLAQWSDPLHQLVQTIRSTASAVIAGDPDPGYRAQGGRFHRRAETMDLQLADINGDCVVLDLHVEAVDQQLTIDDPLPRDTVARFLRELDAYHAEGRSSATVARFMRSLPAGLTSQEYVGTHGTQSIGQVVLGAPVVTAVQGARWPKSERLSGAITSVGFDPDRPFVQVGTTKCSATPEQVERALSLRHGPVVAFVVRREQDLRPRLVSLRSGSLPWAPPSSDDRVATLLADWSETLRILGS